MSMNRPPPDPRTLSARASKVVLAAVLVTAVSGYFMGLHQTTLARADAGRRASVSPGAGGASLGSTGEVLAAAVPEIVEYSRLGETAWKPNAGWRSRLDQLRPAVDAVPRSAVGSPVPPASDLERSLALEVRSSRRAFEGAPPVIPHPVDALAPDNCRACHEQGMAVRGVVARRMSHGNLGSCIQCHVPQRGGGPVGEAVVLAPTMDENLFVGMGAAGRGARAWPGAPPTIPHTLWMRQDCSSCHGAGGLEGLRTSHPERVLCQQCHVPEGGSDVPPWMRSDVALSGAVGGILGGGR